MGIIAIITGLTLLEYIWFGYRVGLARGRYGVAAPAIAGNPIFERHMRVHQNMLENLVIFVPSLWSSAYFWGVPFAATFGVVFMIGRVVYGLRYVADPESRVLGVQINFSANVILLLGGLSGGIASYF